MLFAAIVEADSVESSARETKRFFMCISQIIPKSVTEIPVTRKRYEFYSGDVRCFRLLAYFDGYSTT
ncbi:hypothetical protein KUC3_09690 [Alteromonas sp. KC3]|nr:hypothetical protein KUC3_09690 [Alteromonas sp. KC3]